MARATRKKATAKKATRFKSRGVKRVKVNWRGRIQAAQTKFDDAAKQVYLDFLAKTGRRYDAAAAAGVTQRCVRLHVVDDEEFAEAYDEALAAWRDKVLRQAEKLALEGVREPVASGGKVVAHKRVYATNILAMEMRRVEPAYKERHEHDVNLRGGVLVAPPGQSPEEWARQFAKPAPDSGRDGRAAEG